VRVFVLDAASEDESAAIARAHGAEVETRSWTGFVNARRTFGFSNIGRRAFQPM